MNRNANSNFTLLPSVNTPRSTFSRPSSVKTSFNVGELIPFYLDEVLPGDTFQIKTSMVARMQPMITAPMDDIVLDRYYFFVPHRLVWDKWVNLMGENTDSAWIPQSVPVMPTISGHVSLGSLADYFGLPITNISEADAVSVLPFRSYAKIVNDWFRDENLDRPLTVSMGSNATTFTNGSSYTDIERGGKPFKANKLHDYFTSCLPSPQKGEASNVDIGSNLYLDTAFGPHGFESGMPLRLGVSAPVLSNYLLGGVLDSEQIHTLGAYTASATGDPSAIVDGTNLVVSGDVGFNVNDLRKAIVTQQIFERDARYGTRYIEYIKGAFNVTSPDARLQRSEYLGGNRINLNISQVVQQSSTVSDSPQGNVTGMSLTSDSQGDFIKSFTEHGFVIGLMVARYKHTYQQGIDKLWTRRQRFDYYDPLLANLGEQPVFANEIYYDSSNGNRVFGYNEAWAEYRYKVDKVTGEMRSNHSNTLDSWHFADDYSFVPSLSASWLKEDKNNVDRTLAVTSSVSNQIYADIYIENDTTRCIPLYSVPGLERI